VFGDGPYFAWEQGPYRRLLRDVERSEVQWLLHVGDILWAPCSDDLFRERRAQLDAMELAVVYTPGDNEWTDCHERRPGGYDPLERLAALRAVFFDTPGQSLGGRPMDVVSQAADALSAEFPENVRWMRGGFVFATLHVVGSGNGMEPFEGRTEAHDLESARRLEAAVRWMEDAFESGRDSGAKGLVLAFHADPALEEGADWGEPFRPLVDRLRILSEGFPGKVVLIHGDSHELRVDHPLRGSDGEILEKVTRIETMGSPDIGWLRVVLDTVAGDVVGVEPRVLKGWW
jgi:hypothetical protein